MFFFLRSVRTAAKVANNLPNFSEFEKKVRKKRKKPVFRQAFSLLMQLNTID